MRAHAQLDAAREKSSQGYKQLAVDADQLRQQLEKAYNEKPIDTYIRKCEELSKKLAEGKISASQYKDQTDRLAESMHNAGKQQEEGFGSAALGRVAEMAAAYLSVEKAIGIVTEGLRALAEQQQQAGERAGGELAGITSLAQTARTPEEFQAGLAEARQLRPLVGGNQAQAEDIAAKMLAANLTADEQRSVEEALRNHTTSGATAGTLIENIRGYQQVFGGSFEEVRRKALETSRDSGGRFAPEEALALALRAKEAGNEGASGDDLLGTIAEVGIITPQSRQAAKAAQKYFDTGEAPFGYDEKGAAAKAARIRAAGGDAGTDLISSDPRLRASRSYEESKGRRELTEEEQLAEGERLGRAIREGRTERAAKDSRMARFGEWFDQNISGSIRSWNAEIQSEATGAYGAEKPFSDVSREDAAAIKDYLRRQTEAAERQTAIMERNDSSPPPSGRQE